MMLFCEGACGKCANRKCLEDMNTSYLVEQALQMLAEHPTASLGRNPYSTNEAAVSRLAELGYEVETLPYRYGEYPELPEIPIAEDYETTEEYEKPKGTMSRNRRITRRNVRIYCAEAKRAKYLFMSL